MLISLCSEKWQGRALPDAPAAPPQSASSRLDLRARLAALDARFALDRAGDERARSVRVPSRRTSRLPVGIAKPQAALRDSVKTPGPAADFLSKMRARMAAGVRDAVAAQYGFRVLASQPTAGQRASAHANLALIHLSFAEKTNSTRHNRAAAHHAWLAISADRALVTPYVTLLEGALRYGNVTLLTQVWEFWARVKPEGSRQVARLIREDWELERTRIFLRAMKGGSSLLEAARLAGIDTQSSRPRSA